MSPSLKNLIAEALMKEVLAKMDEERDDADVIEKAISKWFKKLKRDVLALV